jgi:Mg2+-importing ATPase
MLVFGPVSSLFDISFFVLMVYVFQASEAVFQTSWFIESLATQVLVIYIIRSRHSIFKSRPSKWLTLTTLLSVTVGILIPYTPIGTFFGFEPLKVIYLAAIMGLVILYLVMVENVKRWFFQRYGW